MSDGKSRIGKAGLGALLALCAALIASDLRLMAALSYRDERAFLVLGIMLGGGLFGALRLWLIPLAAFASMALLWLVIALTPLDRSLAEGLPREDPLGPADAIYVLASDVQPDGDVSVEGMLRLVHGLELVGQGLAPHLVIGELAPPHGKLEVTARRLLDAYHLGADLSTVGPVSVTRDEAVLVGELARKNGWKRVLLVTSKLHSRRAAGVFEAQGLEVVSSPAREGRYDLEHLESPDDRIRAFPDILHERLGIWVYRRRGWFNSATN